MKLFPLIALLLLLLKPLCSQDYFHKTENQHTNNLVLVHPTLSNLERYTYLIDEGILDPGKIKIVGLCFEAENYNYDAVIQAYPEVGFHIIRGTLSMEDLFRENEATEEFRKIFDYSQGIIFNGGPDIPPAIYGESMSTRTVTTDPYRCYYELSLLFHLLGGSQNESFEPFLNQKPEYSILGICLGMQSMNVATGGDLIQDIPYELYNQETVEDILAGDPSAQHRNYHSDFHLDPEVPSYNLHPVKVLESGRMGQIAFSANNSIPLVFSSHHQAIGKIGKGLVVTAFSIDNQVIEAVEHLQFPNVFGIQFHPEVSLLYQDEKSYKTEPFASPASIKEKLEKTNSMDFHIQLWKSFSESLIEKRL